jgi:hypothetical protein
MMNRVSIAGTASRFAIIFTLLFGCTGESSQEGPKASPRGRRPPAAPEGEGGLRVLFIGNSLTYANDLPLIVQALAKAAGQKMYVEAITSGGFSLDDHWSSGEAPSAIKGQRWDFVVLQHGPSTLPESRMELRSSAKKYDKIIRKAGGRPALYMVWPSLDRFSYFDAVREAYSLAASDVNGVFMPAGEAWRAAWRRDPDAPLYGGDDFHPSVAGSYTAALSIYGMLSGKSPVGLPSTLKLDGGRAIEIPPALAKLLQEAAAEANKTYGRR